MCDTRRSDRVCVTRLKSPGSLGSFPHSAERKEIQRICLHSRDARINWEDCMSVPRAGDSCFTRKVFGGGPCLSRPLASPEETVGPTSREALDSPPSAAEGGPPARRWTHGQTGLPCGPTAGGAATGAAGSRGFAPRPRPRPGCECGGGSGPWAGSPAGRGAGGARRGLHPRMRIRSFAFSSPLFKSKSYNL